MSLQTVIKKVLGRSYRRLIKDRISPVWLLYGDEKTTGIPVRLLYIGGDKHREYLRRMVFSDSGTKSYLGAMHNSRVDSAWRKHTSNVDLIIVKTSQLSISLRQQGFFEIPAWVDVMRNLDKVFQRLSNSKSAKRDLREIKKHGYEYKVVSDPASFYDFYYSMYLPLIHNRYRDEAIPATYEQLLRNVPRSELLLVTQYGETLGGMMLVYGKNEVQSWKEGLRDGNTALARKGVIAATYVFEAQYLSKKGIKNINQGGTRTFFRDGQFRYKKKWGISLGRPWDQYFYLKVLRPTSGAKAFLMEHPFLHLVKGNYHGAAFVGEPSQTTQKNLSKLVAECTVDGMQTLTLYRLDKSLPKIDPASFGDHVNVQNADAIWS